MAARQLCSPCRKGLEMVWVNSCCSISKHLEVHDVVKIPRIFICTQDNVDYKRKGWNRWKKNDPEIDYFLNLSDVQTRIQGLATVLGCSIDQATELVKRDSPIGVQNPDLLYKRIKILLSHGFSAEDIIANPAVLHRTPEVLQQRLDTLTKLKDPPNQSCLHILKKSNRDFWTYVENRIEEDELLSKFPSRHDCFASILDCDLEEVKQLTDRYDLESVSPVLLKSKVELFQRFRIPTNFIHNKLYLLLNLSVEELESRLQTLKDNDLLDYPYVGLVYMSRETSVFKEYVSDLKEKKEALEGCSDKADYFIFRLKCSRKVAEGLASKMTISTMSDVKLRKMLNFFLDEMEMSPDFVVSNIYLMTYSVQRLQSRWALISPSVYNKPKNIPRLLSMSDSSFQKIMKVDDVK